MKEFICYVIVAGLFFLYRDGYLYCTKKGSERPHKVIFDILPALIVAGCVCIINLLAHFLNPDFDIIWDTCLLILSFLAMYISITSKDKLEVIDRYPKMFVCESEEEQPDEDKIKLTKARYRTMSNASLLLANLFVWMI